jgi:uncharacterized membrane protein
MARVVKDRGASGQGSIIFRQNMDYPKVPGQITYYPPEPSDELRNQVKKDKAGGLILYIVGFALVIIGYIGTKNFSTNIEGYAVLIPVLLLLGLVFAILFLFMDNVTLAKLSRAMPVILMFCLVLLYITSIVSSINDLSQLGENSSENEFTDAFNNLSTSLLNPAFFLMSAGLMICHAGGTMLWTSTKIRHEFIPGMIIIETPQQHIVASKNMEPIPQFVAPVTNIKLCSKCSKPLDYIEEYGRYYCYDCQEYSPKEG